ncbi:MAG: hypothetical protein AB7S48_14860 [Bacteroidales bacterium]
MQKIVLKGIGVLLLLIGIAVVFFIFNTLSQYNKLDQGELNESFTCDTIPFTYTQTGHIQIKAKINNSSCDYLFILDSGAGNHIFENFTNSQNLESNGFGIGVGATKNIFFNKIRKINSIQIGNAKIDNINASEMNFDFDCSEDICGIIGTGLMKHFVWEIDFKKQIIILSKQLSRTEFTGNEIEIPLSENRFSHHLSTNIKFGKNKESKRVLIDLGNSTSLSLEEERLLKDSLTLKEKIILGLGAKGLGKVNKNKRFNNKYYLLDSLIFSDSNYFVNKVPVLTSRRSLNLLGLKFFMSYKTIISWKDKMLILVPNDSVQNFIWNTYGFSTTYNKDLNKAEITSIIENSPASRVGIELFSEVVSVNDKPLFDSLSYCEYKQMVNISNTINLGVKYNDSIKTYTLTKELLFE